MKKELIASIVVSLSCASLASAQMGRTLDWPTFGGDPQRSGWEKSDSRFKKEEVAANFKFLWKVKPEAKGPRTLMPPVIIGTLIGYRGFKELAFIGSSDGSMHVMDSDLNRVYWERRFEPAAAAKAAAGCPSGMTATPTLLSLGIRRPRPAPGAPGAPPPPRPSPNPMFGPRAIYVVSADGMLRRLNVANGADTFPPVAVLPANAQMSPLNMSDNVIYTTTSHGCGGAPNAVWAIDIGNPAAAPKVARYDGASNFVGLAGIVIGADGTIYAQAEDGLIALTPRDLQKKGQFSAPAAAVSPVVFDYKGHDLIVSAGKDGRLFLLDSQSLSTALSETAPAGDLWGGLSTWLDGETRWVLATAGGSSGSIVAFKLEEQNGKPALTKAWSSAALVKPAPPVIASGVVFALSNGEAKTHATLHALDASTGQELWSTGNQVTAAGNQTGLTIANGRVYFATADGTMWVFGIPLEW